ncbi:MAG: hypothetical protein COZ11_01295 [Deltaproteobacteria bacterium CG_4_10_14_3_um_filter_51_14]|nr:MAG: hypothetical protein COZ11_01295 [Deltaproteobacteria bacterium CG_4_10_14_3_um_filter_51_14]
MRSYNYLYFYIPNINKEEKTLMNFKCFIIFLTAACLWLVTSLCASEAVAGEELVSKRCLACHTDYKNMPDIAAGEFDSLSNKAKTFQATLEGRKYLFKFRDDTEVVNAKGMKGLKAPVPIRVHFSRVGSDLVASKVVAKPVIKVPDEQLVSIEEMESLVALGPEKGNFTLVDSRPEVKYNEGHIPGAISIPFPKMSELSGRLPKDKNSRIIFYCEGFR